jgi:hypothetical protein
MIFEATPQSLCFFHSCAAERSGKLLRLTLQQTVEAPALTKPARLPECLKPGKLSKLLQQHINGTYGAMITGHLEVDTTYIQVINSVMVRSYIHRDRLSQWCAGFAAGSCASLCV